MSRADSTDVLIIGDGIAGCTTAITAHEAGAKVLIIDKAPADVPHGNTHFSGGSFRRAGTEYSADRFYNDIVSLSGNRADPELTRIVVDNSAQARDWLAELGVPWTSPKRTAERANQADQRGTGLAASLRRAVRERSIPVLNETEALRLIQENGRVCGVVVKEKSGEQREIRAGAVAIATGGFGANPEMVKRYLGAGATNLVLRGSPFNTGDGLRMAEAVGAPLDWMDDFHGGLIHYGYRKYPQEGAVKGMRSVKTYETCILVNQEGRRFIDEGENTSDKTYAKFGKIIALTQPDGVAYAIVDAKSRDLIEPMYYGPEKEPIEAASLEELAGKLGLPVATFLKTIADFNAAVRDGKALAATPPKTNFAQTVEQAPFIAYKVTGGFTFTFGGVRAEKTGEVLDRQKQPIPGLFAVGEIVTGIFYGNYAGGSSLARCAVYGRIVGFQAAHYAVPSIKLPREIWKSTAAA
jgi:tricarballylate dehydrogenase